MPDPRDDRGQNPGALDSRPFTDEREYAAQSL